MIKHVVMWQLKDEAEGNSKSENETLVIDKLEGLKAEIAEIETLEVGKNLNTSNAAYDLVLITTHKNNEALATYVQHPIHQEAALFIGKVVSERSVVDFES